MLIPGTTSERAAAEPASEERTQLPRRGGLWRSSVVLSLCAALVGGGVTAGVLLATGASSVGSSGSGQISAAQLLRRYDEGVRAIVTSSAPSIARIEALTSEGTVTGTGTVVDSRGLILTNYHVVEGASTIQVTLAISGKVPAGATVLLAASNGGVPTIVRTFGSVEALAPSRDLAIIRVPIGGLHAIIPATGIPLVGQRVVAIGFALGQSGPPSVTSGIVAATDRAVEAGNTSYSNLIQTDAAINRGNSGGPLVDMSGHVLGINSVAASAASGEDVGFAIGIDQASSLIERARAEFRSGK